MALVLTGGWLGSGLATKRLWANTPPGSASILVSYDKKEIAVAHPTPAWGELEARDIEVERPEEYAAAEMTVTNAPAWSFEGMELDQTRSMMATCGVAPEQLTRALSPQIASVTRTGTVVLPDRDLVLSLSPAVRAKLYRELARFPSNHYMQYPFCFQGGDIDKWFQDSQVEPEVVALIKSLLYKRNSAQCFSDFEVVMRSLPSEDARLNLVKALSRQRALLVHLRIRPDSDVDKILGYWDKGLRVKDARPLLESVKRLDDGGTISLMYLLPRFARERLYTFPDPPKPEDPNVDCHWSTMNFFNDAPDNRFANPTYTVQYLRTNYYEVSKANSYGDIVLILNGDGNAIHSAVYLADDIVFTKNGNNFAQPWMLVRLNDLVASYAPSVPPRLAVYRNKAW